LTRTDHRDARPFSEKYGATITPARFVGYKHAVQFFAWAIGSESVAKPVASAHRNYANARSRLFRREPDVRLAARGSRDPASVRKHLQHGERVHFRRLPAQVLSTACKLPSCVSACDGGAPVPTEHLLRVHLRHSVDHSHAGRGALLLRRPRAKSAFPFFLQLGTIACSTKARPIIVDKYFAQMSPEDKVGTTLLNLGASAFLNDADPIFIQLRR